MGEPVLTGQSGGLTNVYEEHEYTIAVTFSGTEGNASYYGKDLTFTKLTNTTWRLTLPKPYTRVSSFEQGWKKATGADPLAMQITTDNVANSDASLVFTSVSTNSAGTATKPADGDTVWVRIGVSSNPLNAKFTGSTAA